MSHTCRCCISLNTLSRTKRLVHFDGMIASWNVYRESANLVLPLWLCRTRYTISHHNFMLSLCYKTVQYCPETKKHPQRNRETVCFCGYSSETTTFLYFHSWEISSLLFGEGHTVRMQQNFIQVYISPWRTTKNQDALFRVRVASYPSVQVDDRVSSSLSKRTCVCVAENEGV